MSSSQRYSLLDQIVWNAGEFGPGYFHPLRLVKTFECWRYESVDKPVRDKHYRLRIFHDQRNGSTSQEPLKTSSKLHIEDDPAEDGIMAGGEKGTPIINSSVGQKEPVEDTVQFTSSFKNGFDHDFEDWLRQSDPSSQLSSPDASKLLGGMRVVFCDRPNMTPGMSINRRAFKLIETAFGLHPTTLPTFFDHGGPFSMFTKRDPTTGDVTHIYLIIKVVQKVEVCNSLLSLRYNVQNQWTDAFVCGADVAQSPVSYIDPQADSMILSILTTSIHLWTNPLLLPYILLQTCMPGTDYVRRRTERQLIDMEEELGVTQAGQSLPDAMPSDWPMGIDVKQATKDLHSILPQILFMENVTQWQQRYAKFLLDVESQISNGLTKTMSNKLGFIEIRENIAFSLSRVDAYVLFFVLCKGRANLQINVLFSIISQKDAMINMTISNSTKRDSISMATFTFITAVFLPGSFIATIFSMTMFNWQASGSKVVGDFWIFWAIAVPLTILTLAGWYLWFQYSSYTWDKSLKQITRSDENKTQAQRLAALQREVTSGSASKRV